MAKVTYLIGAGASAGCLPVVSQIPERLLDFYKFVHDNRSGSEEEGFEFGYTLKQMEDDFLQELQVIIDESKNHQSIDTYAKKLRINAAKEDEKMQKYYK